MNWPQVLLRKILKSRTLKWILVEYQTSWYKKRKGTKYTNRVVPVGTRNSTLHLFMCLPNSPKSSTNNNNNELKCDYLFIYELRRAGHVYKKFAHFSALRTCVSFGAAENYNKIFRKQRGYFCRLFKDFKKVENTVQWLTLLLSFYLRLLQITSSLT
jgi:hypothetical protein